jgi:large subunit ribosomal protein L5
MIYVQEIIRKFYPFLQSLFNYLFLTTRVQNPWGYESFQKENSKKKNFMNRLHIHSQTFLCRDVLHQLNRTNIMAFPKLTKITVTTSLQFDSMQTQGIQNSSKNSPSKSLSGYLGLEMICGQKLKKTRARQFISGFLLRKGEIVGCQATLRNFLLFSFLEKVLLGVLPKIREFSGFPSPKHFHVSCGLENFLLFPECENHYEVFEALRGFQITLTTTAQSSQENALLLSGYQIPFELNS